MYVKLCICVVAVARVKLSPPDGDSIAYDANTLRIYTFKGYVAIAPWLRPTFARPDFFERHFVVAVDRTCPCSSRLRYGINYLIVLKRNRRTNPGRESLECNNDSRPVLKPTPLTNSDLVLEDTRKNFKAVRAACRKGTKRRYTPRRRIEVRPNFAASTRRATYLDNFSF